MSKDKLNKKSARHYSNIFALLVTLTVLFLTIGYSAFQNTGIVSDITATVRPDMNVKITDLQIDSVSDGIVLSKDYNTINNNNNTYTGKIISDLTFTKTTSEVTFKVEVTNFGNTEMGVSSISGLPSNLDYELDTNTYDVGEKLCDKTTTTKCTLGSKTDIYITIKYKNGSGTNTSTNLNIALDLTFKEVHNIYYGGNDIDYVLDGENKTVSLGTNAPDYIQVTGTYTTKSYVKPNVTINGVTSDITIEEVHKIYLSNSEVDTVVHGGNVTVDLGNSAPSNVSDITISGTYASRTYSNPNLTINGVTTDIYITISSSGGGSGTPDDPYEDNSGTYDPDDLQEGTTVYIGVEGEPQVTVENGVVTEFTFTSDTPVTLGDEEQGVDTGFIPFQSGKDFELHIRALYPASSNQSTQGILLDVRNRAASGGDSLQIAYTSGTNLPYLYIRGKNNPSDTTNSQSSRKLSLVNNILDITITYRSATGAFTVVYNNTNYSITKYVSIDNMSIYLGYSLNTQGAVIRQANTTIYEFYVKEI